MAKKYLNLIKKIRVKTCLKCGHQVILNKGFFLCEACRKYNSHLEDLGNHYQSYIGEELRTLRLRQYG